MSFKLLGIEISFDFWFFAVLLVFILIGRDVLFFYFILPIIVHELGHIITMTILGVRIKAIRFKCISLDLEKASTHNLDYSKEIMVHLAGALCNIALALYLYIFAFKSVRTMLLISVNLAVAIFNLLPIRGLDGGMVLELLLEKHGSSANAYRITNIISFTALIPLALFSVIVLIKNPGNVSLLLVTAYLFLMLIFR